MTYTYKLARRLAVSRNCVMLATLAILAACDAEPGTAPDVAEATPDHINVLSVYPRKVTAQTGQTIRFRGLMRSARGDTMPALVAWASTGGKMSADGSFSSTVAGTFKVVGRGRGWKQTDTSVVVVVPDQPNIVRISISPDPATLDVGTHRTFTATGYLSNDSTVAVGVRWMATGGSIDAGGVYTAGQAGGKYRVVATEASGRLTDTAAVTVNTAPTPVVAVRLTVAPSTVSLVAGATQQFSVTAKMSDSTITSPAVTLTATGGTITSAGRYTAGTTAGTYAVKAVSGTLVGNATVTLTAPVSAPATTSGALRFGSYGCTAGTLGPFSMCIRAAGWWSAGDMAALKASKGKLIVGQGGYAKFKDSAGRFNPTKYHDWVQTLKPYVADWKPYLTDGTLLGVQVIDDRGPENWGGVAITNAQVDQMSKWWKEIVPGITALVSGGYATDLPMTGFTFAYLDGSVTQYNASYMGDVTTWRDKQVAAAQAAKTSLILSLNVINGGKIVSGCYHGGSSTKCSMSPTEIRTYGAVLAGTSGICGMASWKSSDAYQALAGVNDALRYVANLAATKSGVSCRVR